MILDSKLIFSDAQSLIQAATTTIDSTNVIDLGADGKDAFGDAKGNAIRTINWFLNVAITLAGDSTKVELVSCTDAALSADTIVLATKLLLDAEPAGAKYSYVVQARDLHRYLGLQLTSGATELTAGAIDSGLILGYNDSEISDK